jgi:hypothetical protein
MRHSLRQELESRGSALTWNHITDQIGMFCFTGMTVAEVSDDQRVPLLTFLYYFHWTGSKTTILSSSHIAVCPSSFVNPTLTFFFIIYPVELMVN